jgi:hypothetical protein
MKMGGDAEAGMSAAVGIQGGIVLGLNPVNTYEIECRGEDGTLKWTEQVTNLITTEGGNNLLTNYLKGSAYTAAFFVGLINGATPTLALTDVAAQIGGTNGWTEYVAYAETVRQTLTLGAAAAKSIDNTASRAVFTINGGGGTIGGAFVATVSTKAGTTGVIYGEAALGAARTVIAGDSLTITATLTI